MVVGPLGFRARIPAKLDTSAANTNPSAVSLIDPGGLSAGGTPAELTLSTWRSRTNVAYAKGWREFTIALSSTNMSNANLFCGLIADTVSILATSNFAETGEIGLLFGSGFNGVYVDGVLTLGSLPLPTSGDVMRFVHDADTGDLWVGNDTTATWFGGGDPATRTTPTVTGITGRNWHVGIGLRKASEPSSSAFYAFDFDTPSLPDTLPVAG